MSSTSSADPIKPRLLALLDEARVHLQAWLDQCSDEERARDGTPDRWAPKDVVAHLTSWRRISLARLDAVRRGEQPPGEEAVQPHNEATFEAERRRPWGEVLAESDRVFDAQRAAVEALTEAQLAETGYPWLGGFPFWASVAGTFEHTLEHLVNDAREHGDWPHVERLLAHQAHGLLSLDGSPAMRAYVSYSQASFWAHVERPDRAIPLLREAISLDPKLAAEAHQDDGFAALRALPEFHALLSPSGEESPRV
jgi:hypothetical protein